ncbi:MAG: anaerobic ribonucleoside-triphosphate reductase activating protein [Peptostreptococcaceae bacterium]|nr:anaerobic ribonucleoside-triphosphate reductase activating protein [Peptostreptococcaceae bacterium]
MRYAKIKPNDVANGQGIVVSLWTQGCPHRCEGCHNQETWDFKGGEEFTYKEVNYILESLEKDGIKRDLSILGGEPLCAANYDGVIGLIDIVKKEKPDTKIYLWTGYTFEELISKHNIKEFKNIDVLIDGKFEIDKKDLTLKMKGSSNQRVINMKKTLKENKIILY